MTKDQSGIVRLSCSDNIGYCDTVIMLSFCLHLYRLLNPTFISFDDFVDNLRKTQEDLCFKIRGLFN